MGTLWIAPNRFSAFFGEGLGYKTGLALSREEIVDHLGATHPIAHAFLTFSDIPIALRADVVEDAFQLMLHRVGNLRQPFVGHAITLLSLKYGEDSERGCLLQAVLELLDSFHFKKGKAVLGDCFCKDGFFNLVQTSLPSAALPIATELIGMMELSEHASPWAWMPARLMEWTRPVELRSLFESEFIDPEVGEFFDQRFVDYLAMNFEKIGEMHWRQFEALAAEFFSRIGYRVELGPGRNDGGIDVRVWKEGLARTSVPTILVQCKRQKRKVDKVVVKALWTDVQSEGADSGLIVTTSTLAPGADAVRLARAYPIHVADRFALASWIQQMRTPGRGVFLGE